jgi:hypothetical protein
MQEGDLGVRRAPCREGLGARAAGAPSAELRRLLALIHKLDEKTVTRFTE